MRKALTYDDLAAVLRVDEEGRLVWRVSCGTAHAGRLAGHVDRHGYMALRFVRRSLLAHRVVWLLTHGEWPARDIDHINGIKTDNRIQNLRLANDSQNVMNRPLQANNTSGFRGVFLDKKTKKWGARIGLNNKVVHIGYFKSPEEASAAYQATAVRIHGDFVWKGIGTTEQAKEQT